MEKETFINDILNSTNGITKVTPSADLLSKIELRIQSTTTFSTKTIWLVAASIVVLAMINISLVMKNTATSKDNSTISLAASLNKSNQLY
ncbi:MAG: hypothetical protein V4648_06220 [Bacteroidota bacterium]